MNVTRKPDQDEFWKQITTAPKLGMTDNEVLATLLLAKHGENAYNIWKESKVKHYPTVLRSLKKLQKRGFVTTTRIAGVRNTNIYELTLLGEISSHVLRKDKQLLFSTLAKNSAKFRELESFKLENIDDVTSFITHIYLLFSLSDREDLRERSIEQFVEDHIEDQINDDLCNIDNSESKAYLLKTSEVPWIRELIIARLSWQIDYTSNLLKEYRQLKDFLQC
jgi:DNA-binding PadR family transcriptional regulator